MTNPTIKFARKDPQKFFRTLNKRVNAYFRDNDLQKTGNWKLHLKAAIMFTAFLAPYFLILFLDISEWWKLLFTVLMGAGMAGVGMNVMHDGNHGVYSKKKWVNKFMGSSIYVLAGNVYNWQVQHNVLHHTYTNIHGHDEDIDAGRVIRFSKHAKWRKFHKFQHIYSVFLYGLLTFNWALTTDFIQTKNYLKRQLSYGEMPSKWKQWSTLAVTKLVYVTVWLIIPMLIGITWWKVLLGFFVMHYTAGLILSVIFQLAHVVEDNDMPLPNEKGEMKNTWAIHQLFTTANFASKNKIVNWLTGGLNHQVEHHIFPNISHIHYDKIAEIVRETAIEFNLPYNEYETTQGAVKAHFQYLKKLGAQPELAS